MWHVLEGKTAVVTGGTRGIGRSIAMALAQSGAVVAVNYASNSAAADCTVSEIRRNGGRCFAIGVKLRELGDIQKLVADLQAGLASYGMPGLDILVNNIGGASYAPITQISAGDYDEVMSNNVRVPFLLTKTLLPLINDNGRIINISSVGARLSDPSIIAYSMAKAALEAFTRVLAAEVGVRGITVNAVAPGFTAGERNAALQLDPEKIWAVIDLTALRRFGQPEEIADVVLSLASPLGRWITAQSIEASGGFKL